MKVRSGIKSACLLGWVTPLMLIILFIYLSSESFLLFHSLIEIITVVISFGVAVIALGTAKISENSYFTFLGITYGFIGIINLFHVFAYEGINLISSDANVSSQIWILERYFEGISLIVSFYFINRKINYKKLIAVNSCILTFFLISIMEFKIFPVCYIKGEGLTSFKIISEYIINGMLCIVIYLYNKDRGVHIKHNYKLLIYSMIFKIGAGFVYVMYKNIIDVYNILGHLLNFISFCFLYKALFKSTIIDPFSTVFDKLNKKATELELSNEETLKAKLNMERYYKRYQKVLDFMPDGILVVKDNRIKYANFKILEMLGLKNKGALINKSVFSILESDSHEEIKENLKKANKFQNSPIIECKLCFEEKKCSVEISSLYLDDNDMDSCILALRDITDKKRVEEMRLALIEKNKQEEVNNEFFSNISHELKTPINVIYSALQLQNRYIDNLSIEDIKRYNKVIRQNCLRLIRLINNLIDTTKIEAGFLAPKMKPENIVSLTEDIALSILSYARNKNINIIFDTQFEEAFINCDLEFIERIMLNLLSNAVKYGKNGGLIKINIYSNKEGYVTIKIKDNGIGIPKCMTKRIFEKLGKVDTSLSRQNEGSGIGLTIAKSLIEMQNGSIEIKSALNRGTEIFVSFPLIRIEGEISCNEDEDKLIREISILEKVDIEFSDIYA
ncbi:MASE3 domain-containing sensor histidine kinase [Clostridium polynesiense]|uniref:sensor histidine kinase n=1 Tax=Clostridium polynesiense TaxID=1325933 RepID=UPI000590F3DE|nr:MASE3 domain-containing protein [Clostridium polynesiense]